MDDHLTAQAEKEAERAQARTDAGLSPEDQLALLEGEQFQPVPYAVAPQVMNQVTDEATIAKAIRSAELAGDNQMSLAWKTHQAALNAQAAVEEMDPDSLALGQAAAQAFRNNQRAKEMGVQGISGSEELARRQAEIATILDPETGTSRAFDSVADLDSALTYETEQAATLEAQGRTLEAEQRQSAVEHLQGRRDRIGEVTDQVVQAVHDPNVIRSEVRESIAAKSAQAWGEQQGGTE